MTAEIKDGKLCIDLQTLLSNLSNKERAEVAKTLAAEEWVIRGVVESLAVGRMFEDGEGNWYSIGDRALAECRAKMLPLMDEVVRETVRGLMRSTAKAEAEERRFRDWAWAMFHAWPRDYVRSRPECPAFVYTPHPDDAAVDAAIAKATGSSND